MVVRRRRRHLHEEPPVKAGMVDALRSHARPLTSAEDLDPLLERIGSARYVLLGEASHGTHEYYTWRAALSRRLIEEKGFTFIAVEGDWPDCYRINRYVRNYRDSGESARDVLHNFERWPTWMWCNEEVVELTEWLREHNQGRSESDQAGFYGLDVYSLWDSLYHVLAYVARHEPSKLSAARRVFQCFQPYGEDAQEYAHATRWIGATCEEEVIALLAELRRNAGQFPHDGREAHFSAEQNALVVKNAENYYRTMVRGGAESWNVRDRHMFETLERLMQHHGPQTRAIVWEHNTHIGDARFTDMADDGMFNVGQLVRQAHKGDDVALVGFSSYRGSVIAGYAWEAPMERMVVPPARSGSWEDVLHEAIGEDALLLLDPMRGDETLLEDRGHRAIGVVYHPEYERHGNYVPTELPNRYDAMLYLDETTALRPLRELRAERGGEVPETYPTGL